MTCLQDKIQGKAFIVDGGRLRPAASKLDRLGQPQAGSFIRIAGLGEADLLLRFGEDLRTTAVSDS